MERFNRLMVHIHDKIDFAATLFAIPHGKNGSGRPAQEAVSP
jgi:hypothetical protein